MFKKAVFLLMLSLVFLFSIIGGSIAQAESGQVEITVAAGSVGDELEETKKMVRLYMEENPEVKVNVVDTPDLSDNRLGFYRQFLRKESSYIDVYQIDVIWPGDLSVHFVDLYNYIPEEVIDQHFEAIIENNTVEGKLVGLPWYTDAGLLYYRKDLLEKYALDPPETWQELERIAWVIKHWEEGVGNSDLKGYVWQGAAYEGLTCNALEWINSHGGGQIIEPDGTVSINNENAVKALNRAADWIGDISPQEVTDMSEDDALEVFKSGNAIFMRNWPYAYAVTQKENSNVKGKVGIVPIPAGPEGEQTGTLGGWQLAISRYSKHPKIAADLIMFMASYEQQKRRAIESSYNPTIKKLYEDKEVLEASPFMGELYDVFVNAVPRPSTVTAPHYSKISREFYSEVYSVLTAKISAQKAVEYLEKAFEEFGFTPGDKEVSDYIYYTVKKGDTLVDIAVDYGTNLQAIIRLNKDKIDDPALIYPGQRFKIPQ